jgi:hypothetical protein
MAWAVSNKVAILWVVVAFSVGFGTRHAVGDDEPAAAAPLSAALVSAGQSDCFDGCDGVPFTNYMQSDVPLGDVLALDLALCFASGANMTQVLNSTAKAAGQVILRVDDATTGEATVDGGHFICLENATWDSCADATKLENDGAGMLGNSFGGFMHDIDPRNWKWELGDDIAPGKSCDNLPGYDHCGPRPNIQCEEGIGFGSTCLDCTRADVSCNEYS